MRYVVKALAQAYEARHEEDPGRALARVLAGLARAVLEDVEALARRCRPGKHVLECCGYTHEALLDVLDHAPRPHSPLGPAATVVKRVGEAVLRLTYDDGAKLAALDVEAPAATLHASGTVSLVWRPGQTDWARLGRWLIRLGPPRR